MLCFILSVPIKCKDFFALWIGRRLEIILNIICFWNALINKPLSEVVGKRCRPWRILRQSQSTDSDHPEIRCSIENQPKPTILKTPFD